MSLDHAIDQLMETDWSLLDTNDHEYSPAGRLFPTPGRVQAEFRAAGTELELTRVELFDCVRAEWDAEDGQRAAVVGATREEAAVYALARIRRRLAGASAAR